MLTHLREFSALAKRAYDQTLLPVCEAHGLTRMELDVLLFLANNPDLNTATELVNTRHLTKSHVSQAVKHLTELNLISAAYHEGNHKTVHLTPTDAAETIILDGRLAQNQFMKDAGEGIDPDEFLRVVSFMEKILRNLKKKVR